MTQASQVATPCRRIKPPTSHHILTGSESCFRTSTSRSFIWWFWLSHKEAWKKILLEVKHQNQKWPSNKQTKQTNKHTNKEITWRMHTRNVCTSFTCFLLVWSFPIDPPFWHLSLCLGQGRFQGTGFLLDGWMSSSKLWPFGKYMYIYIFKGQICYDFCLLIEVVLIENWSWDDMLHLKTEGLQLPAETNQSMLICKQWTFVSLEHLVNLVELLDSCIFQRLLPLAFVENDVSGLCSFA